MNILFLCDEYPPCQHGGIGTVYQLLARNLVSKGHNVYVAGFYPYFRKSKNEETDQGVKVFRYFYGSKLLFKFSQHKFFGKFINIESKFSGYINFLKKLIKENQIDIIETPDFVDAFIYSGPKMIQFPDFGIPLVVKLHGSFSVLCAQSQTTIPNSDIILKKEKNLLNSANKIIAVSDSVRQRVEKVYDLKRTADVLYNGIVLNQTVSYNTQISPNTVAFVGKLFEIKGIFSLIKAWPKVIEAYPSAQLLLYGNGDDNSINMIKQSQKNFPNDSIVLKGFVSKDELPNIYSTVACAVFPSYQEAFSMAPMEAMAVSCPVIFTKRTSGPELITDGEDGLLIDPDNIQEIADAILFMLNNRAKAIELGQKGYKRIKDFFDISIITDQHIEYYKKTINS